MLQSDDVDERKTQLESYLNNLLRCKVYRNHHETVSDSMQSPNLLRPAWFFF